MTTNSGDPAHEGLPDEAELIAGVSFYCANCGELDPDPTSLVVPGGWRRFVFGEDGGNYLFLCPECEGVE